MSGITFSNDYYSWALPAIVDGGIPPYVEFFQRFFNNEEIRNALLKESASKENVLKEEMCKEEKLIKARLNERDGNSTWLQKWRKLGGSGTEADCCRALCLAFDYTYPAQRKAFLLETRLHIYFEWAEKIKE